jgi:hypothetical protein
LRLPSLSTDWIPHLDPAVAYNPSIACFSHCLQLESTLTSHSSALSALREDLDREWRRRVEKAQAATSAAAASAAEKEKQVGLVNLLLRSRRRNS